MKNSTRITSNITRGVGSLMNFIEPTYGKNTLRRNDIDAAWQEVGKAFRESVDTVSCADKNKIA
jgi:hypothetical protein